MHGTVENDGTLPFSGAGKLALYGSGARSTIKGGTGSGDVNVRHFVNIEEGLEHAGFTITTKKDAKNHGFGIKSISYTVKKYNGTVQFGVKDHFFSIRILIPKE